VFVDLNLPLTAVGSAIIITMPHHAKSVRMPMSQPEDGILKMHGG
jgi:hypothetical protein